METFWNEIHYFGVKLPRDSLSTCLHGNTNAARTFKAEVPSTRRDVKLKHDSPFNNVSSRRLWRGARGKSDLEPGWFTDIVKQDGYVTRESIP